MPPPTLCSMLQCLGSHVCQGPPGPITMAKPSQDVELSRLVRDQPPGQVAPGLAPPVLAEHLPNVPSYRPSITRIPVLTTRRTALSNSSFARETRSSVRRLGSVISCTQHARARDVCFCMAWAVSRMGALVKVWGCQLNSWKATIFSC